MEDAYRDHFPAMMRVAYLLTGSNEAAEDIVHDVFISCASRLGQLDHPASYLRQSVVNACRKRHRRHALADKIAPDPEVSELSSESVELRQALLQLDHRKRAAIVLRYYADLPHADVARSLGCRPATARSLVRRGVMELRELLDD